MKFDDYAFDLRPLSNAEGGGWLISWPDLPGCVSDGESPEDAIQNGRDAFAAWMTVRHDILKNPPPKPATTGSQPARFVLRTPKSLHTRLVARAKAEGTSLNTLVTTFIAERLGPPEPLNDTITDSPNSARDKNKPRTIGWTNVTNSPNPETRKR
jgi:antitoxin HicB